MSLDDAKRLIAQYVAVYKDQRVHSSPGYITPKAMLEGRQELIHAERDRRLEEARVARELAVRPPPLKTEAVVS